MNTENPEAKDKINSLLQLFAQLEDLRSYGKTLDTLRSHLDMTRRAEEYILGFRQRLADIFQEPDKAFQKFASLAMSNGVDAAAENMSKDPDAYGTIKGWSFGPLNNPARSGILKLSLPGAVRTAIEGFTAHMQTGGGPYSREDLKRKVDSIKSKLDEAEKEHGSSGQRIELELQIAELAKEISFRDLAALPKEQYRIVETLRDKYRNLIQTNENDPAKRIAANKKK
ncbi:MAG: hypothetical protein EYC62_09060 [Alphaproteobacteria bacterium]|nr:MAG: hypothetical protein EYC62_09060 [Alphaproteobacteria bacterium]